MSLSTSIWRNPERFLCEAGLTALLLGITGVEALQISGRTGNGMVFTGEVVEINDQVLHIRLEDRWDSPLVGMALDSLESLALSSPPLTDERFEDVLINLIPLTPYWDLPTLQKLLIWVNKAALNSQWDRVFYWTKQFIPVMKAGPLELEFRLLNAQALEGMGLYADLAVELEDLNKTVNPVDTPLILCWLNARSCLQAGEIESARFWTTLPSLQIPVKTGSLARELAVMEEDLAARIRRSPPLRNY